MKPYYEAFNVCLYHGDSLDLLSEMHQQFGCFVTDPPYTAAGGSTNGRSSEADTQFFAYWLDAVMVQIRRVVRPEGCGFAFCDWRTVGLLGRAMRPKGDRQTERAWNLSQALCWDREHIGLGSPFRNAYEMIGFARGPDFVSKLPKNLPTVIRHRWPYGAKEHHGAEKPVGLLCNLVDWAALHGTPLLDPFAGSGSTLIAARQMGVPCVGIELQEHNCEVAAKRLEQESFDFGAHVRRALGNTPNGEAA